MLLSRRQHMFFDQVPVIFAPLQTLNIQVQKDCILFGLGSRPLCKTVMVQSSGHPTEFDSLIMFRFKALWVATHTGRGPIGKLVYRQANAWSYGGYIARWGWNQLITGGPFLSPAHINFLLPICPAEPARPHRVGHHYHNFSQSSDGTRFQNEMFEAFHALYSL